MKKLIPALLLAFVSCVYAGEEIRENELNLHNSGLTSVNNLSHMTHLNSLDLSDNPRLTSIQGILPLTNLTKLVLRRTRILTDLSDIVTFKFLQVLDLSGVFDKDEDYLKYPPLEFLTSFLHLQSLDLSANDHVHTICPLIGLSYLTYLCLTGDNNIHDIESLGNMTSLVKLEMRGTYQEDISYLAPLTNLESLAIDKRVRKTSLPHLPKLKELYCS